MFTDLDLSGKSAVVLDDNPQMRAILRSMLASVKLRSVTDFSDPHLLFRFLETRHVDVAIIDLVLNSDWDGLELAERIRHNVRSMNPTMPIIMVTGYPSMAVIDQVINCGIDELVTKPLRATDLIARVAKVLDRPRTYIRTPSSYFGPDRRRRDDQFFSGQDRRTEDMAQTIGTPSEARAAISRLRPDAFTEQRTVDEAVFLVD